MKTQLFNPAVRLAALTSLGMVAAALVLENSFISTAVAEDKTVITSVTGLSLGACDEKGSKDSCTSKSGKCKSYGTLMQWSCGNSFSGGPNRNEPLVTDRPDFTEASSTVGVGVAQFELGYKYTNDDASDTIGNSYPELLVRYGIFAEWLELRVVWNYATEETARVAISGSEDLYLGMKIALTPQEGVLPEMALIPQMTVSTGAPAFAAGETLPGLNWVYGWEVNDAWSTAGSTQLNRSLDEATGDAYTEFAQSWTIGCALSDRIGGYAEWFAFFPHSANTAATEHYFNGGFAVLLSDDVQWDVFAGRGINDAADDYFVGTGLSIRLR